MRAFCHTLSHLIAEHFVHIKPFPAMIGTNLSLKNCSIGSVQVLNL